MVLSGLDFRSLYAHMTGIDLSPEMVDRLAERGCYILLVVGNAESFFILPAAEDPHLSLNSPRYSGVKFKVFSVNVNGSGGINVNG